METVYKFHRTVKVAAGNTITVWSSDAEEEHIPSEGQLVMKVPENIVVNYKSRHKIKGRNPR